MTLDVAEQKFFLLFPKPTWIMTIIVISLSLPGRFLATSTLLFVVRGAGFRWRNDSGSVRRNATA